MRDMPSLRQLEYFIALVECGSFRAAAERCGISQPSLSVQLANLERLLDLQLVERGRGGTIPTAAGREVLDRARGIRAGMQEIMDMSAVLRSGLGGTIRFGASATLGPYLLPHVVARLHQRYPDLKLYIREGPPRALIEGLARGDHDIVLVHLPTPPGDFEVLRLFREPLELVAARDHPFATRDMVERAELAGQRILTLGPGYALHQQVADLCSLMGATLHRDYEGTSLDALRLMAGMGMGVTFLPGLYVRSEIGPADEDVSVLRLAGPRIVRSIGLVTRRQALMGDALPRIAATIRETARSRFGDVILMAS
ncbi:MAG: LysR substrate-binding domain-containing protein [Alkalilacustris sp.]